MRSNKVGGASLHRYVTSAGAAWRVRWRERGRQYSRSFPSEMEATRFARSVGVVLPVVSAIRANSLESKPLVDLIPRYVETVRNRGKPGSAHANNIRGLLSSTSMRLGWTQTGDVTEAGLDAVVELYGRQRCAARKAVAAWKAMLRWASRNQRAFADAGALTYQQPSHSAKESVAWTPDEVERLFAACDAPNEKDSLVSGLGAGRGSPAMVKRMWATRAFNTRRAVRAPLLLMVRYAPRPKEVCLLRVRDWNPVAGRITIPAAVAKNGRARSFPVDDEVARSITTSALGRQPEEPLFRNAGGRAWLPDHLKSVIRGLMDAARLPGTPYSTRHTACTRLCQLAKGDLGLVQSITGHRTLSELQRYLHATDRQQSIADAYGKLSG